MLLCIHCVIFNANYIRSPNYRLKITWNRIVTLSVYCPENMNSLFSYPPPPQKKIGETPIPSSNITIPLCKETLPHHMPSRLILWWHKKQQQKRKFFFFILEIPSRTLTAEIGLHLLTAADLLVASGSVTDNAVCITMDWWTRLDLHSRGQHFIFHFHLGGGGGWAPTNGSRAPSQT